MGGLAPLPLRGTRSKLSLPGNLFRLQNTKSIGKSVFECQIDESLTSSSTVIPSSSMVGLPSILQETRRKASKVKQVLVLLNLNSEYLLIKSILRLSGDQEDQGHLSHPQLKILEGGNLLMI